MTKFTKVMTIKKSKAGKNYIEINEDVTLKKGGYLTLQKPKEQFDRLVAAGKKTQEQAENALSKIQHIIYDVFLVEGDKNQTDKF